ncbi:DUF2971 domain-containing protein [Algicola sagamiensis]|uniref:DUF2971 domain-containing protein n=1 Tax=Algicola sagamiensis TaxID=163869 RepID=UPI0003810020|nr:DUF2971 domain-containing protein [Algicola sagamiensis]
MAIRQGSPDSTFWKFRTSKMAIDILHKEELWFAKPKFFNDPFDSSLTINEVLSGIAGSSLKLRERLGLTQEDINQLNSDILNHFQNLQASDKNYISELENRAVFCVNRKIEFQSPPKVYDPINEPLMWSHYADEHRGICLGFNLKNLSSHCKNNRPYYPYFKVWQIYYGLDGVKGAYDHLLIKKSNQLDDDAYRWFTERVFLIKARNWEYEGEYRFMLFDVAADKPGKSVSLAKDDLEHVVFGINTEPSDKELVRIILDEKGWSHVSLWNTSKDPNNLLSLEFSKYNP